MARRFDKISLQAQTASYEQVLKELRSGRVRPWYSFTGPELFFLDRLQEAFEALIAEDLKDFNFNLFYGRESRPDRIVEAARSYPMMAERRLVIVRDFLQLGQKGGADASDDDSAGDEAGSLNDLIPYLEKPSPATILLLIDSGSDIPGNKKIGKVIKGSDNGFHQHFETQTTEGLSDWVVQWSETHFRRSIEPDAARLLVQMVGDSLQALSTELDKLYTFKDTGSVVSTEDVKKVVGETRRFSAEDLKNAILARDAANAMHIAEQLLQQADNVTGAVIRTVAFLNSVFINLWQVRLQMDRQQTDAQIAELMGINTGYLRFLQSDARRFQSADQLQLMLEYLLDAEASVKGFTRMDVRSAFLMLVTKLTTR